MTAFTRRVKVRARYDSYPHEKTHVYLPDGSHHEVEKTAIGRSSSDYDAELKELINPWEKDAILDQAEQQKGKEWEKFVSPLKPLDKGGLRAARSNVDPSKVKNWDTFEISFDKADVATPDRQQAVFDEVVDWAKSIHTEGLEGGRRAFTIQEWHGLDGSSSRPHLRLELHRIGWEPTPKLTPSNGNKLILDGKVQQRTNYNQESGETDKDWQPLVESMRNKFGIHMQIGAPSLERETEGQAAATQVPADPALAAQEAARLIENARATPQVLDMESLEVSASNPVQGAAAPNPNKSFELRKPVDPFADELKAAHAEASAAQRKFEMLRAAHLTYAENGQLREQIKTSEIVINDLRTEVSAQVKTIEQVRSDLEVAETNNEALVVDLQQKGQQLDELKVEATEYLERAELAETDRDNLKVEVDTQRTRAETAETERDTFKAEAVEQRTRADTAEVSLGEVRNELKEVSSNLTQVERERDGLAERNNSLAEQNGELKGHNRMLEGQVSKLADERDTIKSELKMARDELAPIVAENKTLKEEKARLETENQDLATNIKWETERRRRLLTFANMDHETLDAKVSHIEGLYDKLQAAIGNNPEALKVLDEVSQVIKPKSEYTSISEAYVNAGMPVEEDRERFKAFTDQARITMSSDGFARKGSEVTREAAQRRQTLANQPVENPTPSKGPKPNPMQSGSVSAKTPGRDSDPKDRQPI